MADAATDTTPFRRGRWLGKYQLQCRIGEGASSEVWKARDVYEQRWVALKISEPVLEGSRTETELREEIRIAASLEHPHIVGLANADRIGRRYVQALPLARESLADRMTRRLERAKAVDFSGQILSGLAYAHQRRLVHRDLKPSNLLVFEGDHLRIADFGLTMPTTHTLTTATGSGTLAYLSPEQAHGRPGLSSDVFSLGLVMVEMLTGQLPSWPFEWPFPGSDKLQHTMPAPFVRLIRKAIQPDYRKRFRDAIEMQAAFERLRGAVLRALARPRTSPVELPLGVADQRRQHAQARRDYGRRLFLRFECPDCEGPISEHMKSCPWCKCEVHYGENTEFPYYHDDCGRGLLPEWRYCPWCWSRAVGEGPGRVKANPRYHMACERCGQLMIEGMCYCPWCHAKRRQPIRIAELPHQCDGCGSSVDATLWRHCPWCSARLARPTGARRKPARGRS